MNTKVRFLAFVICLQFGCATGDNIEYVEGTIDEYVRLHWDPFVKENEKATDERRFERKQLEPVKCTRQVLNNLPEECEEGKKQKHRKKRRRRF